MATAEATTKRTERLDARVTKQEKRIIETAASIRGISITDLLRMSATDTATQIIRENELLRLTGESRAIFVNALLNPPKPNAVALAAAKRFRREVR